MAVVAQPDTTSALSSDATPAPPTSNNDPVVKSKKSRKRAADFMEDEATDSDGGVTIPDGDLIRATVEPAKKKAKKAKKSKKSKDGEPLTADGANGVIERAGKEELETASKEPTAKSMQAEAERTVDHELKDGFGGFASEDDEGDANEVEVDDNAAALLAGFDSDNDDKEDEGLDLNNIPALPKSKKLRKKLEKAAAKGKDEGPGTVYVGRIPHGFYEKEMRAYFSQFGDITKLRLSRNKRTGASKHFAFIEFAHDSVAKIAAEAMDNYLMFGHILKCKYATPGSVHPDVWKGANKKYRKIPHEKLEREQLAAPKTEEKWQKKIDKEQRKRDKKAEKMKAIGLEMPASTLTSPSVALKQILSDQIETKDTKEEKATATGAIEPPADVPKDEVAIKASKKSKKEKKTKKGKKDESEALSEPQQALQSIEPSVEEDAKDEAQETDDTSLIEAVPEVTDAGSTKKQNKKLSKAEKKVRLADKKAAKKAKKSAEKSTDVSEPADVDIAAEETPEEPATDATSDAKAELAADFISLGEFNDVPKQASGTLQKKKPWKVKKPKKERKNLVKARGPKSGLVSTKKPVDPNAVGRIPGLPLLGKGKYDKAKRQAHKELKKKVIAERASRGLPPHRLAGEWN